MAEQTYTADVTISQWVGGVSAGRYGIECYAVDGLKEPGPSMYGLPLWMLTGRQLGEGSRVRVSVEILEEKPLVENPWWPGPYAAKAGERG